MGAQLFGTILSAASGNEEARRQLKEMIPLYSYLLLGENVAILWQAQDYYGAGKEAANIILQFLGEVTIAVPVIKGAMLAIRSGENLTVVLVRALKRTGQEFVRDLAPGEEFLDDGLRVSRRMDDLAEVAGFCFPAGTREEQDTHKRKS